MKPFGTSFQEGNLIINSVVANVHWWIGGKSCMLFISLHGQGTHPLPFTSVITTTKNIYMWYKCPYLHSLKSHTNFGIEVQNDKNKLSLAFRYFES